MDTLIRFDLLFKLILSKTNHAKTTAVLDWNKHFLAFAVEGTRVMSPSPKMGFTQNPRTIKSVFGANAHAFNQGCEKMAMTLIARSQFVTRLVVTLLLVAGLTSMPAQAAQGSTVFIPIAVGDITTFIPIMPATSTVQISTTGGSHNLSWSAVSNASYYQIIITDEHGLQRIFQTTDTYYALAGLSLGNNKVEVQACNAYNQCGIRYLAGTVTITTRVIYQHTDILGSVVAESDEASNIISRSHYEPFGKRLGGDKAGIGYTGHLQDKDLGLTYMQARYYDPLIGRFYSNDPVGYTAANPVMSFNRYLYVNNNPYKYTDPNGEFLFVGALIGMSVEAGMQFLANGGNISKIDISDVLVAGVVGVVTGGIGGRLALGAGKGLISAGSAVRGTATVGGMTSGVGSMASSKLNGETASVGKVAGGIIGGALGAGAGTKLATSAAKTLEKGFGGLNSQIKTATQSGMLGQSVASKATIGQSMAGVAIEATSNGTQKALEIELNERR